MTDAGTVDLTTIKLAAAFGAAKGIVLTFVLHLFGLTFFQQLTIASVSAIIGMAGTVTAAVIGARIAARRVVEKMEPVTAGVDDLKRAQGLTKRRDDPEP